jgi:hypothetical protein
MDADNEVTIRFVEANEVAYEKVSGKLIGALTFFFNAYDIAGGNWSPERLKQHVDILRNSFKEAEQESQYNPPPGPIANKKEADSKNPAQRVAQEALKIAKELSDLSFTLQGLSSREEITEAAGLQNLGESIERLKQLADQYRMGGVNDLMGSMPSYAGWDPEKLRKSAKPFIDSKKQPVEEELEDAEKHRFEKEQTPSPHAADTTLPMD